MHLTLHRILSNAVYLFASALLLILALLMMGSGAWSVLEQVLSGDAFVSKVLHAIGLIIVGTAVFDVSKFLVEEEILRDRELRSAAEARRSLTKFMTIIIIATSLESLVLVFETKQGKVENLIYPTALLFVAVLAVVGLAVFQNMTRKAEKENGE